MPLLTPDEYKSVLHPWKLIELTCKKSFAKRQETGYVLNVFDDGFEFGEVLNKYEHFSNISDPPEIKSHRIFYSEVIEIILR